MKSIILSVAVFYLFAVTPIPAQEQSEAEAAQLRTLADGEFYAAQKKADAEAYQLITLAEAEAESLVITSEAEIAAMEKLLDELLERNELADEYIQLLIADKLGENCKWIISGNGEITPLIDMGETP